MKCSLYTKETIPKSWILHTEYTEVCAFLLGNKSNQSTQFLGVMTKKCLQAVQILYFIFWREHDCNDSL